MAYRVTDSAAIVVARTQDGELRYHTAGGPIIEWLAAPQAQKYLELGVIEHIEEPQ